MIITFPLVFRRCERLIEVFLPKARDVKNVKVLRREGKPSKIQMSSYGNIGFLLTITLITLVFENNLFLR